MLIRSMISFKKRSFKKRKLVLPLILIFILLAGWLVFNLRGFHFQLDWSGLFPSSELVKPIPEGSFEEEVRESLVSIGQELKALDFGEKEMTATFSGRLTVIFSKEKNLDFQVASLQFILWRAKIEGKAPYFVDLRFDKPVVKI